MHINNVAPFDMVMSLGSICQAREQIRRYFLARHAKDPWGSFFWDWSWRDTGIVGITEVLSQSFYFEQSDLTLRRVADHLEVYNTRYGHYLPHDFEISHTDLDEAKLQLSEQTSAYIKKYNHLSIKTTAALRSEKKYSSFCAGLLHQLTLIS